MRLQYLRSRIELSEEGKEALNQKISQLRNGQEITTKYFTDGYYEDVAGVLDAVDSINKELRIYTGFINDTGKELPTIIAFEDILEIGVNITRITIFAMPAATASLLRSCLTSAPTVYHSQRGFFLNSRSLSYFHYKLYTSIISRIPTFRPSSKAVFSHAQHTVPCRSMIFSQSGILSPT